MSPGAGAHGELCGMMAIRAALEDRKDPRKRVLVPSSAHGTNPATAAALGYTVDDIPQRPDGSVDPPALDKILGPGVAARLRTHPHTIGRFKHGSSEKRR